MSDTESAAAPHYIGHRKRLRERFLASPPGTLADYEILEMLLFFSHTRQDVKPLAKSLLAEFGSLANVLAADEAKLTAFKGVNTATLASFLLVREAAARLIKEQMQQTPLLQSWKAVIDYCRATMGHLTTEQFRVLFLDKKNALIRDEVHGEGTLDQAVIFPREVMKRALFLDASALILVHNHPSGETKPSKADIHFTHQMMAAAAPLGIMIHDHIIISKAGHYSFRNEGMIGA